MKFIVLLAAITPPLVILAYGIAKARDSWKSEATWNAFLIGAVSALAAVVIELALSYVLPLERTGTLAEAAITAVLVAAIPEESIKFFVLVSLAEKHVDVRRLQDLLVLALAVSLGFATLENFFFVISAGGWKMTAALRAITAVPGHGIDGLAMGALLIRARLSERAEDVRLALIVPVLLHAAYDFPLLALHKDIAITWFGVSWLLVIVASSIFVIKLCNRVLAKAVAADRAAGRDDRSIESAGWLIAGGAMVLTAGPSLAAWAFHAKGVEVASVAIALSIFPIAFGIDSVLTGLKRRNSRPAAAAQALD
ncbi:PrsW family glutamic-type intramembrane protease [Bradyrhizobium sp. McL0615]|uniref:PrsW family glutamic-type intramembrane protease n=1 Tax=Bradyrhizobium sp. McL0615 TaxID=3415673 RepID=UPI003CED3168